MSANLGRQFHPGTESWTPAHPSNSPTQLQLPGVGNAALPELPPVMVEHAIPTDRYKTFGEHGRPEPTGRTKPIERVYRGMSHAEWDGAQRNGYIRSDERGNILPGLEGTNAGVDRTTAEGYLHDNIHKGRGVVVEMHVHPDDHWFLSSDSYMRTRHRIPLSRVVSARQFNEPPVDHDDYRNRLF